MPKTVQTVLDEINGKRTDWTEDQWKTEVQYRGLAHKFDKQLVEAKEGLFVNLNIIINKIDDPLMWPDAEGLASLIDRRDNIKQKVAAVDKEQEFRAAGKVTRKPVGTTYYADYINGSDAIGGGLTTTEAWKTIHQYTSVTVRSPGDILKLRANTTWDYGAAGENQNIVGDEAGTYAARIQIKGCDSVDDPWGDASDVQPIVDFGDTTNRFQWTGAESYWRFDDFEIKGADGTQGGFTISWTGAHEFVKMKMHDCLYCAMYMSGERGLYFEECEFTDCGSYSISCAGGGASYWYKCKFDGGTIRTATYAVLARNDQYFEECEFGVSSVHNGGSISSTWGTLYCRSCKVSDTVPQYIGSAHASVVWESFNQVEGDDRKITSHGDVRRETTVVRSGGSSVSARLDPISGTSNYRWDRAALGNNLFAGPLRVWCSAVSTTITVYIRSRAVWTTYPTAAELFIQADYMSNATTGVRSKSTASTQVLTDETTWVAFTTTFTPAKAGWVFVNAYLGKYQSGCGCYVDMEPLTS